MNQPPASPQPPQYQAPAVPQPKKSKQQLVWALVCLIGPTALIVVTMALYAILNFIIAANANDSIIQVIFNVPLFVINAVSMIVWLPGIIVGIILLTTRK